jgi:hypothetical protein
MSTRQELLDLLRLRPLQRAAEAALLSAVGAIAFALKLSVLDPDVWWHLKVGDWILQNMAVPHVGILSRTAAQRPWVAYSWAYEVMLSRAYAWFGLVGIGVFGTFLTVMVAYSVYWMARRLSGQFWLSLLLSIAAFSAFLFNGMPRPFFFSIALFCVMLTLILEAHRTGRQQLLYWLPLVFMVWANLHIQFVYGLFVLGLYVAVNLAQTIAKSAGCAPEFLQAPTLPAKPLVAVTAASFLATLIGPNTYHPYVSVLEYSQAKFSYQVIVELQPLSFRGFSHFAELFLGAAGFYAIGFRKKLDPFQLVLMVASVVIAFRTMRDAWFLCTSAVACIADFAPRERDTENREEGETWLGFSGVAVVVIVMLVLFTRGTNFNERALDRTISGTYPVNAVNFLRQNPIPGPLYNNLNWGGFLMWYMPDYPVAIDGRNDLYGDQLDKLFYDSQSADTGYATDPYLNEAGVVILDSTLPLAKILTIDPRFTLVYRDQIATVFARRPETH